MITLHDVKEIAHPKRKCSHLHILPNPHVAVISSVENKKKNHHIDLFHSENRLSTSEKNKYRTDLEMTCE